jgi:hypothetical protein
MAQAKIVYRKNYVPSLQQGDVSSSSSSSSTSANGAGKNSETFSPIMA